jgi:hypothetical protein
VQGLSSLATRRRISRENHAASHLWLPLSRAESLLRQRRRETRRCIFVRLRRRERREALASPKAKRDKAHEIRRISGLLRSTSLAEGEVQACASSPSANEGASLRFSSLLAQEGARRRFSLLRLRRREGAEEIFGDFVIYRESSIKW